MTRDNLIQKLTDRKLASSEKNKAFCVCLARAICYVIARPAPPAKK